MSIEPFSPPSKVWRLFIYPFVVGSLVAATYFFVIFLTKQPVSNTEKIELVVSILLLYISGYSLIGYRYTLRAAPMKNQLYHLAKSKHAVMYIKYDRVWLNDQVLRGNGLNPHRFRWINQSDLGEVYTALYSPRFQQDSMP